jgi:hypothetical protein
LKELFLNLRHLYFDIVSDFELRISDLRKAASTNVEKPLQIRLFYAKQTQSQVFRFWLSCLMTSKYGNWTFGEMGKQTQYKPNIKPIKANFGPKMSINYESKAKQIQIYPS